MLRDHVGARGQLGEAVLAPDLRQLVPFELMRDAVCPPGDSPKNGIISTFSGDLAAVGAWLAANASQQSTWLAYRKEAERLLLWATTERRKPLAALDAGDRQDYLAFLRRPAPERLWVGPRAPRDSVAWRPFTGPLSESSVLHASRILGALFEWLQLRGHVASHVWQPEPQARTRALREARPRPGMRLETDSLDRFLGWLSAQARAEDGLRYRAAEAAVRVLQALPIGFSDLADFRRDQLGPAAEAEKDVSENDLDEAARAALVRHWHDRGLDWDGLAGQPVVLVGPPRLPPTGRARRKADSSPGAGYSVRGLHALLSQAIERYRAEEDAAFAARSPRDLAGRRSRMKPGASRGAGVAVVDVEERAAADSTV
ncbi:hypothetical protein [Cupriavidus basilensis]